MNATVAVAALMKAYKPTAIQLRTPIQITSKVVIKNDRWYQPIMLLGVRVDKMLVSNSSRRSDSGRSVGGSASSFSSTRCASGCEGSSASARPTSRRARVGLRHLAHQLHVLLAVEVALDGVVQLARRREAVVAIELRGFHADRV